MQLVYVPLNRSWKTTTPATDMPVTATHFESHHGLADTDDIVVAAHVLADAVDRIESVLSRALLSQTITLQVSCFPSDPDAVLELPGGLVSSITSISYMDTSNNSVAWAASNYTLESGDKFGSARLGLDASQSAWPDVATRGLPVTITYVAGYATPDEVPAPLKRGVLMMFSALYDERSAGVESGMEESIWYQSLIATWRLRGSF